MTTYTCYCITKKNHRLIFDGGSSGQYIVELCNKCYHLQDKNFIISEEQDSTATTGPVGGR